MEIDAMKRLAIASLALSIAAVAYGVHATLTAGRILGPSALVVTPGREVWIGVDEQLWRAGADGRLAATQDWAALGLPGEPANLVRHPQGPIVATVRDDATLYFLDPATARVTRSLHPRWPAELERHGGQAINLAFHRDGRVAIATGGGHVVALFDAAGNLLARTAPDSYRFSNGLWWVGDDLWTTDTNRTQLKRLDGATLALRQTVALASHGAARFLGPARGHPQEGAGGAPMAALIRFENGMISGRVSAVDRDGHEAGLAQSARLEPHDLDWLDGDLLLSDGVSFSVLRWSADGAPREPFGDSALHARLQERLALRNTLQRRYTVAIAAAIAAFGIAALLVLLATRQESRQRRAPDLSQLGTPLVSTRETLALQLRLHGPLLVMALPLLLLQVPPVMNALRQAVGTRGLLIVLGLAILIAIVTLPLWFRRMKRLAAQPEFEPVFNALATRKLQSGDTVAQALRDGERVLETFMLHRATLRWAVLTDERLLIFKATLLDERIEADVPLERVVAASTEPGALTPGRKPAILRRMLAPGSWIEIGLRDGEVIAGSVASATLAQRLVERLTRHAARGAARPPARADASAEVPATGASPLGPALASALVPGVGQWMQGRGRSALMLFVPWLGLTLFMTTPLVWTIAGPRADVSARTILWVAGLHLLYAATAAWDAWRMATGARR